MALRLEISALGERVMQRDMLRFAANLEIPTAALSEVGVILRQVAEEQFDSEGAHASGRWAPLAAATVREKARKGLDPRILHATGRLRESLTRKFDADHIEALSADSLRFGTTVPYGVFHQSGTRRMPRRPPLGLTEGDKRLIVKTIQRQLIAGVKAAA